ncbi:MAG: nicotinate-nucleotide--dimethylbenzimidazole phosphoribosyltransferase [Nakamurella sp.]
MRTHFGATLALDLPDVMPLDVEAAAAAASVREQLPVGAFGVWGAVIDLLAAAAGSAAGPLAPRRPQLVVFAADHDIAELGVSAATAGETQRRAAELSSGRGLPAALADAAGVGVTVVDVGMAQPAGPPDGSMDSAEGDPPPAPRPGRRIDTTDAMTEDELTAAVHTGRRLADTEIDAGADLLIGAVCGVGVSTPVATLTAALTGMEPVDATSRGSGIDDAAWIRKAAAVRDALFRVRQADADVLSMLRTGGGPDLAALTGFIAQAAIRRRLVLIHDMPSTVAAVLAHRLAPGADNYLLATSLAPDRGHQRLLDLLGREPITDWSITGHSGVGALLVVPALAAAAQAFDDIDRAATGFARSPSAISSWDANLL